MITLKQTREIFSTNFFIILATFFDLIKSFIKDKGRDSSNYRGRNFNYMAKTILILPNKNYL